MIERNFTSQLVPYSNDRYGVSLSYPEHLSEPEVSQTGLPALKLDLGNREITVNRKQATPGKSLADLAKDNIEANTNASGGRIISKDLGRQTLGGLFCRLLKNTGRVKAHRLLSR